jgi:hypothetical protein
VEKKKICQNNYRKMTNKFGHGTFGSSSSRGELNKGGNGEIIIH